MAHLKVGKKVRKRQDSTSSPMERECWIRSESRENLENRIELEEKAKKDRGVNRGQATKG
jgi:hypothetical protein